MSQTTVSHALSGSGRVNEATRQRVLDAAGRLGYRPSPRAQALRRGRSQALAIASSMDVAVAGGAAHQGFFLELAAAAAERAFDHRQTMVLLPPLGASIPDALPGLSVDGVIVVEPADADPIVHRLRADTVPFVAIGRFPGSRDDDLVIPLQTEAVASLLIEHLVAIGSRRPALLLGDRDRTTYRDAEATYRRVAERQGWDPIVRTVPEADGEQGGYAATERLLQDEPGVDAVAAWVDAFASGAVRAAADAGRTPPDLTVVTRYDGPRARAARPPITAVELRLPDAARAAVDLLLGRITGEPVAPATLPAPELVIRESSRHHQHDA